MTAARRLRVAGCAWAAVAAVVALAALYVHYALQPPSALDFRLHHSRYEALVSAIKSRGPAPAADDSYPATGFSRVAYFRDSSGGYEITITTDDYGHFGYMGYIYSDHSKPDRIFPVWSIAPHWWGFHDNTW